MKVLAWLVYFFGALAAVALTAAAILAAHPGESGGDQ